MVIVRTKLKDKCVVTTAGRAFGYIKTKLKDKCVVTAAGRAFDYS